MINLKLIQEAQKRIEKYIRKTPIEYSSYYSELSESEVYLKFENLQLTGSFKIRGALNAMLQLSEKEIERGIVTASAGNHAQGIGFGAQLLGLQANTTIIVPRNTPDTKIKAIQRYGINLEIVGEIYDEAEQYARQLEKEKSMTFISPYNHRNVMAGQGTIVLEILSEVKDLDYLLVPLSGGGLLGGILVAAKEIRPQLEIYGIQTEACPVMVESMKKGKIVDVHMKPSIAEGLHGGVEKNTITFEPIQKYVDDILVVSEIEIKQAILDLIRNHQLITEGAGAVGLAAVVRYRKKFLKKKGAIIISGRNIDFADLKELFLKNI